MSLIWRRCVCGFALPPALLCSWLRCRRFGFDFVIDVCQVDGQVVDDAFDLGLGELADEVEDEERDDRPSDDVSHRRERPEFSQAFAGATKQVVFEFALLAVAGQAREQSTAATVLSVLLRLLLPAIGERALAVGAVAGRGQVTAAVLATASLVRECRRTGLRTFGDGVLVEQHDVAIGTGCGDAAWQALGSDGFDIAFDREWVRVFENDFVGFALVLFTVSDFGFGVWLRFRLGSTLVPSGTAFGGGTSNTDEVVCLPLSPAQTS